ncbi:MULTISPECIES: type I glyceraldehyde-3-phosphate dehydrogenase [Halocynthiibacter]|uniref:Aldehyde dehydrogenase n=1 Tax=Halocynthiibacter halioticoli TaxID=2986804 RepID=A0AAE3IYQ0_9RHOB|nr:MULTISPECIES: glyceraldehyde 3-phosphate dehydrogenase NAD-binding domain-containing protein [Halocynthiibacter]MCV6824530.1 aldehyde dehydrogenase [Halocynthiibacter halioticoli]MCW4057531.1 aldehyde dehydrogenase [Halocynthiibacter sp. SDUM655004]
MRKPIRVFINGFGRIGRTLLRQILSDQQGRGIEVVGINDIAPLETCAYLFRYDSVFGPYPTAVEAANKTLKIGSLSVPFHNTTSLADIDLTGVDVVLECTGKAKDRETAEAGLSAGARNVLISGPSPVADQTIVLGANDQTLGDGKIISNASCTTNAIAPLLRTVQDSIGFTHAHITTIHCYTGSQPTVDQPGATLERSRAAAVSMVPTSTSAASQIAHVLPEFDGRLSVSAVRVPTISVSAVDAVFQVNARPGAPIEDVLQELFGAHPQIGLTNDACVSSDFRARPESLVLSLRETQAVGQKQLRLFGWYDNEWGFSARMLDMAERLAARV